MTRARWYWSPENVNNKIYFDTLFTTNEMSLRTRKNIKSLTRCSNAAQLVNPEHHQYYYSTHRISFYKKGGITSHHQTNIRMPGGPFILNGSHAFFIRNFFVQLLPVPY